MGTMLLPLGRTALVLGIIFWASDAFHEWTGGSQSAAFSAGCTVVILGQWLIETRRSK